MKVKIKSLSKATLSIRCNNGLAMETISLASGKVLTFENEKEYMNYSDVCQAFIKSKTVKLDLVEAVAEKAAAVAEDKSEEAAEEVVEEAAEEVVEEKSSKKNKAKNKRRNKKK